MPTTDSNLTGTFIANTYQKLLQIDTQYGSVGTTATFNVGDAVSTSKYTLLNGLGQKVPGFVVDTTGNGNGGIMFKDQNSDPYGLWSIQTYKTSNNEGGLNFWRPSAGGNTDVNNAKLFLKNTGSVWVGYQDIGAPVIPSDVPGYSLYVKDGIRVGDSYVSGFPRMNLIGSDPQYLVNDVKPIRFTRYSVSGEYILGRNGSFFVQDFTALGNVGGKIPGTVDINGQASSDWYCSVVGIYMNRGANGGSGSNDIKNLYDLAFWTQVVDGFWKVCLKWENEKAGQGYYYLDFYLVDVMMIHKSLAVDTRNHGAQSGNYYIPTLDSLPTGY